MNVDTSLGQCIADPKAAHAFILAGNAYLTLVSKKTGTRYTYRVNLAKENVQQGQGAFWVKKQNNPQPKTYFVKLLAGPDNTADYVYLGIIQNNNFRLTRKSKMTSQSAPVIAFGSSFGFLVRGIMPPSLEVWHHGKCGRCGRMLTVPEYKVDGVTVAGIALGIGPECAGKL